MFKCNFLQHPIVVRITTLSLGLFYGSLMALLSVFKIIKLRSKFFQVKRRDNYPEILNDPRLGKHHFVQLKNVKLHYVSNGNEENPLMLFLHGFPEFWFSWKEQLKEFSKDYFVVALDMRGYGESEKLDGVNNYRAELITEDIREFIESFNRKKIILVAHDWGGVIAWRVAMSYPEKLEKLIILNAPHPLAFRDVLKIKWKQFFMSWYMYFFNLPILPELIILSNDLSTFNQVYKSKEGKNLFSLEELEAYKYIYSKPNALTCPLNYYRANLRSVGYSKQTQSTLIKTPTLIIWALNDTALSEELAPASAKYCENVTIRNIANCSHWVQHEQPQLVNQYIRDFLSFEFIK